MSTYIISDIHGCYRDFQNMLDKISLSVTDQLILAGDYIDRGKQNYEMLKWIEECPKNIQLVRGNHEEEFVRNIEFMLRMDQAEKLSSNLCSNKDGLLLYESVKYFLKNQGSLGLYFDLYGTIRELLEKNMVTIEKLCQWAEIIQKMPYYYLGKSGGRAYVVVHGGYAEKLEEVSRFFSSMEEFYLYARKESYLLGGIEHGTIIAGHTPTIVKGEFCFNKGNIFRYYNKRKDCVFYYIDCGCVFRERISGAKLACIRLEDKEVFYV